MGGTSTDISLISGGQASLSADGMLAGQRIALRSLDIASIARRRRLDRAASMPAARCMSGRKARARCRARPATAMAARPRPSPTPISCSAISMPTAFWAASAPLDRAAAEAAVDRIADALDLSRVEAAAGIYRMINMNMADGIRLMTVRRGVDPRKFALLSFRRRGGPARDRSRARARNQARHRADGGVGAVGLGHAGQRSALRGQPHAFRRGRAHHRR